MDVFETFSRAGQAVENRRPSPEWSVFQCLKYRIKTSAQPGFLETFVMVRR
jgi:hypothetical protein